MSKKLIPVSNEGSITISKKVMLVGWLRD